MLLKRQLFGLEVSFSEGTAILKIRTAPKTSEKRVIIALSHPNTSLCPHYDWTHYLSLILAVLIIVI